MTTTTAAVAPVAEDVVRAALSGAERPPKAGPLYASQTFAWRTLVKIKYVQDQLGSTVVFPIILTLVFTFLLGGAIAGSPREYLQFFLPGVIVVTVVSTSMTTALTLNRDIATGMFDRIRTLPIWQPSVVVGAMAGDIGRYALASVVPLLVGLALGFRPHGGVVGVILGLLFLQLFTFCLAWLWMLLAVLIREPNAAQGFINLLQFVLIFGSNVMAPLHTMPGWLEACVKVNPVTHAVTAVRGLMNDSLTAGQLGSGFLASAILLVLFVPPTVVLYNRKHG